MGEQPWDSNGPWRKFEGGGGWTLQVCFWKVWQTFKGGSGLDFLEGVQISAYEKPTLPIRGEGGYLTHAWGPHKFASFLWLPLLMPLLEW